MIIAANKMDMPDAEENLKKFKEQLEEDIPIFPISAATDKGFENYCYAVADTLEKTPEFPLHTDEEE